MITRIEIDGFKSFLDSRLDVPPFPALVGPNASGKSNLFDALDYVREESVLDARRGRPHEFFHRAAMGTSVAKFEITVDFVSLVPDVVGIEATVDERRQEWSFDVVVDGQGSIPSTVLSDGTLRILGLLTALHDPEHSGVLMIEEIENGLHPSRLAELLRRIRQRVTDPQSHEGPLRQVILTSHSPVLVSELYRLSPESPVFVDTAVRVDPSNERVSRRHRGQADPRGRRAWHVRLASSGAQVPEFRAAGRTMSRSLVAGLLTEGETDELFLGTIMARQLRALTKRSPRCAVDVANAR